MRRIQTSGLAVSILALAWCALPAPAGAIITGGGCVNEVSGTTNNCTSNDVTFVVVGLGVQDDGCVDTTDTVSIFLEGRVRNTTAQERYDIGLYIATDGDPNGDGGHSGTCAREILQPAGTTGVTTCGSTSLDLLREFPASDPDNGPYLNVDGDACGDLFEQGNAGCDQDGDGNWDDTVIRFTEALTFPCDDVDANGFVEIPTCATWGNQNNQVDLDGNSTCDSEAEAIPGTKAKCRCETINSTIPVPQLSLSCSSPSETLRTDETGTFSVTYSNGSGCTPDASLPEREQCGTASFAFYEVDYDESRGSVSNIQLTREDGSIVSGGAFSHDTTAGTITWIPVSARNGTSGIIGPGDSVTLSYDYTYTSTEENVTLSTTTNTYWTNDSAELGDTTATGVSEQSTVSCTSTASATPVTLASARVVGRSGEPVLRWSTATESSNLGFNVYVEGRDGWERVNEELIPSREVDSTAPAHYALELPGTGSRYTIEDVALDGTTTLHGPFRRTRSHGSRPDVEPVDWGAARAEAEELRRGRPGSTGRAARKGGGGGPVDPGPVRLLVDESGVQRVTYEDLATAGFDFAGVPSKHLAVTLGGEPVPARVEPPAGQFGPGSSVEFLGEALDTLYTRTNVYTLRRDVHSAERISEDRTAPGAGVDVESAVHGLRIERDRRYSFASPGDDPWYDTRMIGFEDRPKSWSFPVELPGYTGSGPASVTVELWGVTSWPEEGDHHALVSWNGSPVGEAVWDGLSSVHVEAELAEGLVEASNELVIELPGDRGVAWDVVDLESYTVRYPRELVGAGEALAFTASGGSFRVRGVPGSEPSAYRVTADGPVHLSGAQVEADGAVRVPGLNGVEATYHVATVETAFRPGIEAAREPSGLTEGEAEYLVISHGSFLDGLGPLVALREAGGLSAKVVDVADVYARYTDGVFDPEAIRAYIADAVTELGTRYVLLVGGDTFDYHDRLGLGSVSFVPSLYEPTGDTVRWAPSDPSLADLDGDGVPDVPIGRLPVRSRAELDAVVAKILAYDEKSYGRTALLAADAMDGATGFSFSQASESFARALPAGWSVERAYVDTLGASGARERLTQGLSEGTALTSFMGHSGLTHWTFSNLFGAADVSSLDNSGAPTVVVQWGCWNTYHVEPRFHTLGHRFLLSDDEGAAAVLGSATLLQTSSAAALSRVMAPLIARPGITLGEAVTRAKQDLAADEPERVDALLGWTLLGDPAMAVDP